MPWTRRARRSKGCSSSAPRPALGSTFAVPQRLRRLLHRTVHLQRNTWHAQGQASRGAVCTTGRRPPLPDIRPPLSPGRLRGACALAGNVWQLTRRSNGLAGRFGIANPPLNTPLGCAPSGANALAHTRTRHHGTHRLYGLQQATVVRLVGPHLYPTTLGEMGVQPMRHGGG